MKEMRFRDISDQASRAPRRQPLRARTAIIVMFSIFITIGLSVMIGGTFPATPYYTMPEYDYRELRAYEEEMLSTYGWIDETNGVVRIPIDRAIELTAAGENPLLPPTSAQADE